MALISDDSGASWKTSATVPLHRTQGPGSRPNELQAAELADGTIVLNARDEISLYRLISRSHDGGLTWAQFTLSAQLQGAICQGSTVAIGSTLFFSHPFAWTRNNGWIKYSVVSRTIRTIIAWVRFQRAQATIVRAGRGGNLVALAAGGWGRVWVQRRNGLELHRDNRNDRPGVQRRGRRAVHGGQELPTEGLSGFDGGWRACAAGL